MTEKMIQINVDDMKKELKAIIGYYGGLRETMRTLDGITEDIDKNQLISAHKKIIKIQKSLNGHYASTKKITEMLTSAGCVID